MAASSSASRVAHHLDGDGVGHQLARVHVALGLDAQRVCWREVGAEEVAGGDVRHVQPLGQPLGLGALARARRAYQNERTRSPWVEPDDTNRSTLAQETVVIALHELALDLLHRVEPHADHDQHRGAAEREVLVLARCR